MIHAIYKLNLWVLTLERHCEALKTIPFLFDFMFHRSQCGLQYNKAWWLKPFQKQLKINEQPQRKASRNAPSVVHISKALPSHKFLKSIPQWPNFSRHIFREKYMYSNWPCFSIHFPQRLLLWQVSFTYEPCCSVGFQVLFIYHSLWLITKQNEAQTKNGKEFIKLLSHP